MNPNDPALPYRKGGTSFVRNSQDLGVPQVKFLGNLVLDSLPERYLSATLTACSIPKCSARHLHGWVAKMACGTLILVGRDCCSQIFGRKWDDEENRYKDRVDRADAEAYLRRVAEELPGAEALAAELKAALAGLGGYKADLKHTLGGGYYSMVERAMKAEGGKLMVYEKFQGKVGGSARFSGDGREFATLEAGPFFAEGKFDGAVEGALTDIREAARTAELGNFSSYGTASLRDKHTRAKRAAKKLVSLAEAGKAATVILSPQGFDTIVGWFSAMNDGPTRIYVQDGRLTNGEQRTAVFSTDANFERLRIRASQINIRLGRPSDHSAADRAVA